MTYPKAARELPSHGHITRVEKLCTSGGCPGSVIAKYVVTGCTFDFITTQFPMVSNDLRRQSVIANLVGKQVSGDIFAVRDTQTDVFITILRSVPRGRSSKTS